MCVRVFGSKKVKIRKAVRCWGCEDKYEKGSLLTVTKGVTDNSFWSSYWCPICEAYMDSSFFSWSNYDCQEGIAMGDFKYNEGKYPAFRQKYIEEHNKKQVLA